MDDEARRQLASLGKGMVQVNLRLGKIAELLERGESTGAGPWLEALLDVVEAVDRTLSAPAIVPAAPWWRRWLEAPPPALDLTGLRVARDQAVDRLRAEGLVRAPSTGPVDPRLHEVVETREGGEPGTIAAVHRAGWVRQGDPPQVVRAALVTAFRAPSEAP